MNTIIKWTLAVLVAQVLAAARTPAVETITIDGSSTVYPITEAMAEEFQKEKGGAVRVTVGISGTGGGFKKFCRGETDISAASRPILKKEMEAAWAGGVKYIELPVAFDAITVVVNRENVEVQSLTISELKRMWEPAAQGKIAAWNQVRATLPSQKFALFGPGADSGTFDYFTEAIVGKAKSSRGDFTASEDDNILVQGVAGNKYALGYFGYAYYVENKAKLRAVPIAWDAKGRPAVEPSPETIIDGTYAPLSRPVFIYVNAKAAKRPAVREFVEFYLANAPRLVSEVGMVALPGSAYVTARTRFNKGVVGTVFKGRLEAGIRIEEVLRREAGL
jgi:phosphate transport system substrate-binding protein